MGNSLRRPGLGLILILQGLISLPAQGVGDWQSTQFKAYVGNPYTGQTENYQTYAEALLEVQDVFGTPDDEEVKALEQAMSKIAQWYHDHGFPAPQISEIDETDSGRAYRFYLCTPDRGQALWESILQAAQLSNAVLGPIPARPPWDLCSNMGKYASDCGQDSRRSEYFYINYDTALDESGQITELGYQTMAHELMHAVFPGTGLGQSAQSCRLNGWITEGIADALGYHIAWEEFGEEGMYQKGTGLFSIQKRHGVRPYFHTLAQKRNSSIGLGGPATASGASLQVKGDYFTSSFWRYVADSYSGQNGWDILLATGGENRVTAGLLDLGVTPGQSQDWKREVEWLDTGLRGIFGIGLDKMYANFVAFFSHSMPEFPSLKSLYSSEAKLDYWTTRIFEPCQTVDISNIGQQTVTVELEPLTSTCIKVKPTNVGGAIQVTFSAEGTDPKFLESIMISRADTALLVSGDVIPVATPPSSHSIDWRDFPQDGAEYTYYLLSNIARKPTETRAGKAKVTITIPGFWTNLGPQIPTPGKVAPAPVKPSFNPKAPTLKKRKAATEKMLRQQIEFDKNSLNNRVSSASEVTRQVNVHECTDPFVYQACGKHLQISLSLRPGTYGKLGMSSSQGGLAAQFFGSMMSMSTSTSMSETYIKDLQAQLDRIVGSSIRIAIPLIDYGFSGSFSNASIRVNAPGERTWRAIGPPDENGQTRLTGKVTIDEFSPTILRGSFSGRLAEFVEGPNGKAVYTPRDTVEGMFVTVSPWLNDERIAAPMQSREEMVEDIVNTMGLDPKTVKSLEEQGMIPGVEGAPGSSSVGRINTDGQCSCDCDYKHLADELCELFCEAEFAACD